MSNLIDIPAALVASRLRASVAGVCLLADDAQPRLMSRSTMRTARTTWRQVTGSEKRGFDTAAKQGNQDGRTAIAGAAYVTTMQHFSIRSGPPTSRPPA
jgi:hypothetical protein